MLMVLVHPTLQGLDGAGGFQLPLQLEMGLSGCSKMLHTTPKWDFCSAVLPVTKLRSVLMVSSSE